MIDTAQPANAQIAFDPRAEKIAAVYAEAFVGAAERSGQLADRVAELDAVIDEVLDRFPRFEAVLNSGLVSPEEKSAMLNRVLQSRTSAETLNFFKVVSAHGRLDVLRVIHRQIHSLFDQKRGVVRVWVTTATPLADNQKTGLVPALRRMCGGEPVAEYAVDPALIGGVVLRIGDTVYDGSLKRQLEQMREKMINRSVHEIQSRRDRFRNSDGN
jgi:F-type H+-transporting ATPase subunit delta